MVLRVPVDVYDRNRGQGLPSGLSDDGYRRLLRATQPSEQARTAARVRESRMVRTASAPPPSHVETRRFGTLEDVRTAGFRRVASGCYVETSTSTSASTSVKTAHPIWELRAAEEGEGYMLVRQREERAVDLRQAGAGDPAGAGTSAAVAAGIIRQAAHGEGVLRAWDALTEDEIASMPRSDMLWFLKKLDPNGVWSTLDSDPEYADVTDDDIREHLLEKWRTNHARGARIVQAEQLFLVSLLQTPGGDLDARKVVFANQLMNLDDLNRLVAEVELGPTKLVHDTWSDGEWELRVRGPKGQLIHDFESVGPEEIGGSKGRALLDTLESVIPSSLVDGGLGEEAAGGGALIDEGDVSQGAAMPPEPGAAGAPPPEAGAGVAPSAAALMTAAGLRRGARVRVVKHGQVAEAVVLLVHPERDAVEVMFGGGAGGGASSEVPMVDIIDVDEGDVVEGDMLDLDDVELEGESHSPLDGPPDAFGDDDDDMGPDAGPFIEIAGR